MDYIVFSYQGTTIVCTINTLHEGEAEHNCVIDLLTYVVVIAVNTPLLQACPPSLKGLLRYSHRIHTVSQVGGQTVTMCSNLRLLLGNIWMILHIKFVL